jgi:hypothetical protein
MPNRSLILCLPLILAACGYPESRRAHKAQISMIGMTEEDLQACAGIPDKKQALNDDTSVLQYAYKPKATGAFSINPLGLGTLSFAGQGSECTAIFRIYKHRVSDLHFAGDTDLEIGTDGVCEPIVRGCVRQPEPSMRNVEQSGIGVSGFYSPATAPQPAEASGIVRSHQTEEEREDKAATKPAS